MAVLCTRCVTLLCCSWETQKFPASWQQPRRGDLFKSTNKLPVGFKQFVAPLPSDHPTEYSSAPGGRRSLWATDNGFFYAFRQVDATVSSRKFVTPTNTIQVERLAIWTSPCRTSTSPRKRTARLAISGMMPTSLASSSMGTGWILGLILDCCCCS